MTQERRTRANGRASREVLLAAALEVFAERGHRGTTLKEIAQRVGMTLPGLLHHFPTKDELLLEVVRNRETRSESPIGEHLSEDAFDIREAIAALAEINEAASVEQQLLTTLSAEAIPTDHPLHAHFRRRYGELRERLRAGLEREQVRGTIRADIDPAAAAREILATLDGLHLQWLLDPAAVPLRDALTTYGERLAADLAAPKARRRAPARTT